LGAYEIAAPLGAGGMGEVYRARDTRLNRDVALKILPEAFAGDAERATRFEREAQLLATSTTRTSARFTASSRRASLASCCSSSSRANRSRIV
jgi:serine/threonine protein kinase